MISVYNQELPERLQMALESIWEKQQLKPSEIILVKDGPLTVELEKVIDQYLTVAPIIVLPLVRNRGLGYALAHGLKLCQYDLVARMDSDDISKPDRFIKQITYLHEHPEIDILGTNIEEFSSHPSVIRSYRRLPVTSEKLASFAKKRCPFNHMSLVFKKQAVLKAGNYQHFHIYEDYYLWVRMIQNGVKMANIRENLVTARLDDSQLFRRHGKYILSQEKALQKELLRINFLTKWEYYRNMVLRVFPRMLPFWMLKIIYKLIHR